MILTTSQNNNDDGCPDGTYDACITSCSDGTNPCHPEVVYPMNIRMSTNVQVNHGESNLTVLDEGDVVTGQSIHHEEDENYRVPGERYTIYVPNLYQGMWPDKFRAIGTAPQLAVTPVFISNGNTYIDVIGNSGGPATFQIEIWLSLIHI